MVEIAIDGSGANLVLSWDEAVRFGVALAAGCIGQSEEHFAKRVGVAPNPMCLLSRMLSGKQQYCFMGEVSISAQYDEDAFQIHVDRTVDSVSIVVSHADAWRLRAVVEFGFEIARSRSEYYLRTGLSRPSMAKILAAMTCDQDGSVEMPLEWGDGFLEAPPSPRPPRGTGAGFGWVVVRTDPTQAGAHCIVVESAWKNVEDAHRDVEARNGEQGLSTEGVDRPRREAKIVSLTTSPCNGARFNADESIEAYVVGRVVGQDVGDEELYPGSVWWTEDDAEREAARWNEVEGSKIPSLYQVWATCFNVGG